MENLDLDSIKHLSDDEKGKRISESDSVTFITWIDYETYLLMVKQQEELEKACGQILKGQ